MAQKSQRRHARVLGSLLVAALLLGTYLVGYSGTASATLPPPTISKFTATPLLVTSGNGRVTLKATVSNGVACTLSSSPSVDGLPITVPCSSSKTVVELPFNDSNVPEKYKFKLTAQGSRSSTTEKVKVTVAVGEGGYVFPSKITGTETGAAGVSGETEYYPFNLTFEFDQIGPCVASSVCSYAETSISGSGGEYDPPPPGGCEQTFPIAQSGDALSSYQAEFDPDDAGVEHLSFQALTDYFYPNIPSCFVALDWGLQHSAGDGYASDDVWTPGATSLSATYDDPGVETGTIDFTFSYS
jgi:hypothetical protein